MTQVAVFSYTHSVTYVADNILKSLKDVIRLSGLDPTQFVNSWDTYMRGVKAWLESQHLEQVMLEIYHPKTNVLLLRWDIDISYSWTSGDGSFWTDTDQLRYAIRKQGVAPSEAKYDLILRTKPGRPDVSGWSSCSTRPTDGLVRHALGSTIEHNGLSGSAAYWRRG